MKVSRGDIVLVDLRGAEGSEKVGIRPCVVVQNDRGNFALPLTIVVPITDARSKPRNRVLVPVLSEELGGLDSKDSVIDCGQIRTIDAPIRISRKLGALPASVMKRVDRALAVSLGLVDAALPAPAGDVQR